MGYSHRRCRLVLEKLDALYTQSRFFFCLHHYVSYITENFLCQNERWTPPSDGHDTRGDFDPSVHGFDGMMFTSLPSDPQPIDHMVYQVPNELPSDFPRLLDMNSGRPLGLGKIRSVTFCIFCSINYAKIIGWYQGSIGNGTRSSSATAYLSPKFTSRKNLHVVLNTKVARVHPVSNSLKFNSVEMAGENDLWSSALEFIQ